MGESLYSRSICGPDDEDLEITVTRDVVATHACDFAEPLAVASIASWEVRSRRRPARTLAVVPLGAAMACFQVWAFTLAHPRGVGAWTVLCLGMALWGSGVVVPLVRYLWHPIGELYVTTSDGRCGLLYASESRRDFARFEAAVREAVELSARQGARRGSSGSLQSRGQA